MLVHACWACTLLADLHSADARLLVAHSVTADAVSAEILPAARRITDTMPGTAAVAYLPPRWARMYNGQVLQQEQRGATFSGEPEEPAMQSAEDGQEDADDIEPC